MPNKGKSQYTDDNGNNYLLGSSIHVQYACTLGRMVATNIPARLIFKYHLLNILN